MRDRVKGQYWVVAAHAGVALAGMALSIVMLLPLAAAAQTAAPTVAAPTGAAPAKQLIAVMELGALGATKEQASALTERLTEELLKSGRYTLVDRSQLNQVLEEQALQQAGCTSQECAVKAGKVLGVKKLVTGRVTKLEDTLWQVSATLIDVETAETQQAASIQHDGPFRTLLLTGVESLSARLSGGQKAAAKKRLAVFPLKVTSGDTPRTTGVSASVLINVVFRNKADFEITHSANAQIPAEKSLAQDAEIQAKAWTGKDGTPNAEFVLAKGKQLGVDAVLLLDVYERFGRNFTVYVFDLNKREPIVEKGDWEQGKLPATLGPGIGKALRRSMAQR